MSVFNECHIHSCDCIWLNVFSHAQSLLINHKKLFECFSCFWKVPCFLQKFSKLILPCFGDSVAGRTSRMPQSRVHHREFLQLAGDSLAGKCFNYEKDLEYFSKFWNFMFFAAQVGNLFVGGRSSRKRYTEIFVAQFTTLSLVELPVAKNTKKIFKKFSFKCSGS